MRRDDYRKVILRRPGGMWEVRFEFEDISKADDLLRLAREARRAVRAKLPIPRSTMHPVYVGMVVNPPLPNEVIAFATTEPPLGPHHYSVDHVPENCSLHRLHAAGELRIPCLNPAHHVCSALYWQQGGYAVSGLDRFLHRLNPSGVCVFCDRTETSLRKDLAS